MLKLSSIILQTNVTSPPGVINSFSAAVGAAWPLSIFMSDAAAISSREV